MTALLILVVFLLGVLGGVLLAIAWAYGETADEVDPR